MLNNVYPPAEDSWQTAEVLRWVVGRHVGSGLLRMADVGSGTGVLTLTALREAVGRGGAAWALSIDVDVRASENTRVNLINNGLYQYADVITANLLDAVRPGLNMDIIVSNPPYLPGDWGEDWRIFGGPSGNELIRQLIQWLCNGDVSTVVLTQSSLSNWEDTASYLGLCGFKLVIVKSIHYFFEDIVTMVFERVRNTNA